MTRLLATPLRQQVAGWLIAAFVILAVVWGRAWWSAGGELHQARAAEAASDRPAAVERYQFAMRWYTPGAAAPVEAADALWRLGQVDDPALALPPLRRLRGGILATRWLVSPFGDRLAATNARIARLMAEQQLALGQPTIQGRSLEALEAHHAALLALDPMPAPGWSLLVVLAFLGWVAGGFLTIYRGFDRTLKANRAQLFRWGGLTVVCFAAWLVGLWQA